MTNVFRLLVAALTIGAAALTTDPLYAQSKGVIVERVLVRVNGEIFTQSELTQRQIEALRSMNRTDPAQVEASIAEVTPRLLETAVDELLLVQRGRELGFTFSNEQFNAAIDNIKKDNKLDDEGLKRALAQEGVTMDQLRQNLERSYFIQGVQQREIGPSLTITLEEQRQYYEKNKAQFMTPLTVTIRELMVAVPTRTEKGQEVFSQADDAAAKTKIEALRARAVAGEDFLALVKSSSESATKAADGLIGPINVVDINPALKAALDKLEQGGITEVIRGPRGYQVFKLETRAVPAQRPFTEVRSEIENAIRSERIQPETKKMLARLRAQAVIEWKDEDFKRVYETRLASAAQ